MVGEWGKKYTGAEAITVGELVNQLGEIAIKTFNASLALGLIGAGPILVHQIHRVHEAEGRKKIFSNLAADMKANKAVQDAPEVVGAAVQHVADKSQASNVYIDGQAFMQTMQANKVSIEDIRQVAPEIADQIETAMRTGGDVVIPTGEYAVKIAPTDIGEALSMHIRTAEDQLSAAEAVQVDRVVRETLTTAVKNPEALEQQMAEEKLDEDYKEEAKKLEEQYRAEFEKHPKYKKAEARMQARYGATVAAQMAKRVGIAPSELQQFAPILKMVDAEESQAGMESRAISSDGTFNQSMLTDVMRTAVSKVARIVDRVLNGQSTSGKGRESFEDYLPVSDRLVKDLKEQGLDVEDYQHCVVDADVLHSYKNHGEGNELEKRQIGMTKEDYLRLPLVVSEYDEVHIEGLTQRTNLQGIRYIKTFPDGVQYVVEEVRKGRKKLAFCTAYKKVTPVPDVPNEPVSPPTLRPRRAGVNSLSEDILPVKSSTDQDSYAQSGIGGISKSTASIDAVRAKYQGTDQWLKAPNGEDTQLTETQWCLVRTPEFKAWFGDWENDPANASKVVDKNGEPLVVYHGGQGRVEDFSRGSKRGHMGLAYFTDDVAAGSSYAFLGGIDGTVETPDDAGHQWTHRSDKNIQAHPHITKAFLNIRNPITPNKIRLKDVVNMFGKELADLEEDNVAFAKFDGDFDAAAEWLSEPSNLQEWLEESLTDEVASNTIENDLLSLVDPDGELQASQGFIALHLLGEIPEYMVAMGYDGFAYADNEAGGTTYVVQSPTQVKSASFNNGQFNPNDSNILRQDVTTPTDPLVTIHNIRETGLLNVNRLGALPVPSLAVTKVGNEYSQYGEISLIGTKGMIDPAQTPVFSADAYTARFPEMNWTNSVDRPKAEALKKRRCASAIATYYRLILSYKFLYGRSSYT